MPVQSSPRRFALSLLLSSLLLSTQVSDVLACSFKSSPQKVSSGSGCQVSWDQNGDSTGSGNDSSSGNSKGSGSANGQSTQATSGGGSSTKANGGGGSSTPETGGYTQPSSSQGGVWPSTGTGSSGTGYSQTGSSHTGIVSGTGSTASGHSSVVGSSAGTGVTSTQPVSGSHTGTYNSMYPGTSSSESAYPGTISGGSVTGTTAGTGGTYSQPVSGSHTGTYNTATSSGNDTVTLPSESLPLGSSNTAEATGPSSYNTAEATGPSASTAVPTVSGSVSNNSTYTGSNTDNNTSSNNSDTTTNTNVNNNTTNVINNVSNTNNNNNTSITSSNVDWQEWSSTTVVLMTGSVSSSSIVATIAVNVDMSAETGVYTIPQAPYLTCYGQSYFVGTFFLSGQTYRLRMHSVPFQYKFVSSGNTTQYSDEFTMNDNSTASSSDVCKDSKPKDYGGYTWGAVNNYVYGYTLIQNITNIYNDIVTTVVGGATLTTTSIKTVTQPVTMAATTVTQTGNVIPTTTTKTKNVVSTLIQTSVKTITPSGSGEAAQPITTTVTEYTVSHSGALPDATASEADTTVTDETAGTTAPASASITADATSTTDTAPTASVTTAASGSATCTDNDWDESCEDWADESGNAGASSSAAGAVSTGGSDDSSLYGKAVGAPQVSLAITALTAVLALLGGAAFLFV